MTESLSLYLYLALDSAQHYETVSSDKKKLDTRRRNALLDISSRTDFRERPSARFRNALIFHLYAESPLYPSQEDPADQWRHSSALKVHSHFLPPQRSLSPMRYVGVMIIREMGEESMDVANWEKTRDAMGCENWMRSKDSGERTIDAVSF